MTSQPLFDRLIDTGLFALQLFAELALLFVLISFLVGALQEWLPADKVRHYLSARHGHGYLIGALIGAATPFCSCSTVPLTLGLLKSGAGFGPTMTLLFASPLVNPIIIALFWITFGIELTILYTAMGLGMAIGVSWLMDRSGFERYLKNDVIGRKVQTASVSLSSLQQPAANTQCCSTAQNPPLTVRLDASGIGVGQPSVALPETFAPRARRLLMEAVNQFRSFLPHVVIGVLIGSFAHGFVPDEWLIQYAGEGSFWAIPLAAIVGVPLYVRGSTMIPIAMTLTAKGMGIGAVIALVIGGAGASLPEMVMLKRMFRWPILLAFLFSVFSIAVTTGVLAEAFF
ncbi:permease [Thiosocius teredinicola]|uniref:permease n=1 Tax=Thiosocius teredinicola TaxID=1973002 RepID=UPI0009912874